MSQSAHSNATLEKIVALCKRRGFVYPSAELYGGIRGIYDFGHLGVLLREELKNAWRRSVQAIAPSVLLLDSAILTSAATLRASGHVENFADMMVECQTCNHRFRTDEINITKDGCHHCGNRTWSEPRKFHMMFETQMGSTVSNDSTAYLRPETAQGVYINIKNVCATNRVAIPFGIAQIGKAFRNEVTPKQFLFRLREFEQMEFEWFCHPREATHWFKTIIAARAKFFNDLGLCAERIRLYQQDETERAHYSTACTDIEYEFPFGWREVEGVANRGDYDLSRHTEYSKKDLSFNDETSGESYIPHIIESSIGVDRLFLTILFDAYAEDEIGGEPRTVLRLKPTIAPIQAAVLPLIKKLTPESMELYSKLQNLPRPYRLTFDDGGSIGKRYRRQDEIGTPFCITYDFETSVDQAVTIRDRDSATQVRIGIEKITDYLDERIYSQ